MPTLGKGNSLVMQGYICVYRRRLPTAGELRKTRKTEASDPALITFLNEYPQEDRFYGWGDDPAFFAARTFRSARIPESTAGVAHVHKRRRPIERICF